MGVCRAELCIKGSCLVCRFVSDHGLEGYNAICQRKILTAMQETEMVPEVSRVHPPTQLEWTANQRKGKMVLDVFTYSGNSCLCLPHLVTLQSLCPCWNLGVGSGNPFLSLFEVLTRPASLAPAKKAGSI